MALHTRSREQARTSRVFVAVVTLAAGSLACSGITDEELPPSVSDPGSVETPAGAVAAHTSALTRFKGAVNRVVHEGGILADELIMLPTPLGVAGGETMTDARHLPTPPVGALASVYPNLQLVRGQAQEARGMLAAFAPDASPALTAHMYAVEAYVEIYLADLFCSGIPLSTVDFEADYTLAPGSTTQAVYEHALGFFEAALPLASDSLRVYHLAAVGRGRALLALGRYADAAAAVAAVPGDYRYDVAFERGFGSEDELFLWKAADDLNGTPRPLTVRSMADHEGGVGLDFRSSGDPRTAVDPTVVGESFYGAALQYPAKYPLAGPALVPVASGVEARLIEAEAALQAGGGDWLTRLNALRTSGTFDTQPNAQDPAQVDTLWHAGSGGVAGLRPLEDPLDLNAQVDLLFRERAFWLYLTGQRQGDLRRLIRNYGRTPNAVYPSGPYPGGPGAYGNDVTLPVPPEEDLYNPNYDGCFHRNA